MKIMDGHIVYEFLAAKEAADSLGLRIDVYSSGAMAIRDMSDEGVVLYSNTDAGSISGYILGYSKALGVKWKT